MIVNIGKQIYFQGYELSTADPDKDAEFIHKAWVYADPAHVEQTAEEIFLRDD